MTEDKRSGIRPEYIILLVGQVVHSSVETVRIVKALPEEYAELSCDEN